MGYIGLLLNDPYKRDRIDGCMLDMVHVHSTYFPQCIVFWAIRTRVVFLIKGP
jgi:hypothetical protein